MSSEKKTSTPASPRSPGQTRKSALDNVFSSQRPLFSLSRKVWNPPADVYETPDSWVVKMEVAGLCQHTLQTTTEDNHLVIRGCRSEASDLSKEKYHLMEIRYGQFERHFSLPAGLNRDDVNAQYTNGFLIVAISKKPKRSRKIEIEIVE